MQLGLLELRLGNLVLLKLDVGCLLGHLVVRGVELRLLAADFCVLGLDLGVELTDEFVLGTKVGCESSNLFLLALAVSRLVGDELVLLLKVCLELGDLGVCGLELCLLLLGLLLGNSEGSLCLILLRSSLGKLHVLLGRLGNCCLQLFVEGLGLGLRLLKLGLQPAAVVGEEGNLVKLLGVFGGEAGNEVVLLVQLCGIVLELFLLELVLILGLRQGLVLCCVLGLQAPNLIVASCDLVVELLVGVERLAELLLEHRSLRLR